MRVIGLAVVVVVILAVALGVASTGPPPSTCCSDAAVLLRGVESAYTVLEGDQSHQAVRARAILKSAAGAVGVPLEP